MPVTKDHEYNIHAAKTQLSRIVERVQRTGERITVMRNGVPVADIVPHEPPAAVRRQGRGSLKSVIVAAPDWDSAETNASIAADFGILP
ncbi:type II toxin-antitoxin system prevent-host-death family antitoxin [Acrocarpospora sp. B8E8]|uniref:type II toxin-antitoxin system Phd/YefM family antitoxin n=1 Tax=Acrocarpospora sp. B8E8 TaxID=3153572 RepID=UPI00325DA450